MCNFKSKLSIWTVRKSWFSFSVVFSTLKNDLDNQSFANLGNCGRRYAKKVMVHFWLVFKFVKLRYFEKATQFGKNSYLFWRRRFFFNFFVKFQKIWNFSWTPNLKIQILNWLLIVLGSLCNVIEFFHCMVVGGILVALSPLRPSGAFFY